MSIEQYLIWPVNGQDPIALSTQQDTPTEQFHWAYICPHSSSYLSSMKSTQEMLFLFFFLFLLEALLSKKSKRLNNGLLKWKGSCWTGTLIKWCVIISLPSGERTVASRISFLQKIRFDFLEFACQRLATCLNMPIGLISVEQTDRRRRRWRNAIARRGKYSIRPFRLRLLVRCVN